MFVWILDCIRSQRWPAAAGLSRPAATTHPGHEGTVECSCSGRGLSPVSALRVLAALASEMPGALARAGFVLLDGLGARLCLPWALARNGYLMVLLVRRSPDLAMGARP